MMSHDVVYRGSHNVTHVSSLSRLVQGYFLLRFLAEHVGERQFVRFLGAFVKKHHGHLVLSQVSLSCGRRTARPIKATEYLRR